MVVLFFFPLLKGALMHCKDFVCDNAPLNYLGNQIKLSGITTARLPYHFSFWEMLFKPLISFFFFFT